MKWTDVQNNQHLLVFSISKSEVIKTFPFFNKLNLILCCFKPVKKYM